LSLLIVKSKAHGGFHFDTHTNLYDSLICPLYADLRERLFNEVKRSNVHFIISSDDDKFIYLFNSTEVMIWLPRLALIFYVEEIVFLYS
jgi:hypothetical protein